METTKESNMNITLNNQIAYNDQTGDETTLTGEFEITTFARSERTTGRYTSETILTWTVTDGIDTFGFSRTLPAGGKVDFGSAAKYDTTNI